MTGKRCSVVSTSFKDPQLSVRTSTLYVPKDSINRKISSSGCDTSGYSKWDLRRALRTVPGGRNEVTLQLWSKLHPDESAKATKPIADMEAYVRYLTHVARNGQLRAPPKIALERRIEARRKRRLAWAGRQAEARRQAEYDAHLANAVRRLQASKGAAASNGDGRSG